MKSSKKLKVMQCWDDSLTTDIPLIELLKKHKAKATFNIIPRNKRHSFLVRKKREGKNVLFSFGAKDPEKSYKVEHLCNDEMPEIYKGFTIAAHCWCPREDNPKTLKAGKKALKDTMELIRNKFGQKKVGYVYPGGNYNEIAKKAVREAGYLYARTTKSVPAPLPLDNPMELPSSCHWNHPKFWEKYEEAKKKGGLFYFWGHSCELGDDPVLWKKLEDIYAKISADPEAEWIDVIDLFDKQDKMAEK